ncbi:MAG: MFS transporter, partial [Myxococcota bacterium]|nr:MFS transporter [Myxococcota bacterium]
QGDVLLLRLARQRSVLVEALTVAMAATLMSFLEPVLPLHLHQVFAAGATENGLVFGACVLAYGIVSPITGALSDRLGRNLVSGVGLLGCAVVLPFLGLVPSLLWVGAVMAVFGALLALALAPTLAAMADVVSGLGSDFASGYVITNTAYAGGMMLGPLAGGALMQGWGFNAALWAAALLSLLIGLTLLSSRRR